MSATFAAMPKFDDHPIRLRRVRAGLGQKSLADQTGMSRSTISAIEEGRVANPTPQTVELIAAAVGTSANNLWSEMVAWTAARASRPPVLPATGTAALLGGANYVKTCRSFAYWRSRFAPSSTAFASLLGVNRAVVAGYEDGVRERGMPETLQHALTQRLGVDNDTLLALMKLEPNHE